MPSQKKTVDELLAEYGRDHSHPGNAACHTVGIPLIVASLVVVWWSWRIAAGLFLIGWFFQFLGHSIQGKQPSFFGDWRYLFIGPLYFIRKVLGQNQKR